MLMFPCTKCKQTILVKYLSVGEQAQCKACGTRQPVPANAAYIDKVTEEYQSSQEIPATDIESGYENKTVSANPDLIEDVKARLRDNSSSLTGQWSSLVWLLISIIIFMGAASYTWSIESIIIIVIVILVHELGHVFGMKLFGYRNVRVLFIPMFGAVATGRQTSADSRHSILVALFGPVPGIVIGIAAGLIALSGNYEVLMKYAITSLFLNTFNLLPIFPLDGGRILRDSLFGHFPRGKQATTVLSSAILAALAILLGSMVLGFLALLTLISSVSHAGHEARIILRFRKDKRFANAYSDSKPPDDFINEATGLMVSHASVNSQKPKLIASIVQSAWHHLRRKPIKPVLAAGLLSASLILLIVGVVSFALLTRASAHRGFVDTPKGHLHYAAALFEAGEYGRLLHLCGSLQPEERSNPVLLAYQGYAFLFTGQYDSALLTLRTAYSYDSLSLDVNYGLGSVFGETRQYDSASFYLLRCVDMAPDIFGVHSGLFISSLNTGNLTLALRSAEKCYEIAPDNPVVVANLAIAHHYMGNINVRDSMAKLADDMGYGNMDELDSIFRGEIQITPGNLDSVPPE